MKEVARTAPLKSTLAQYLSNNSYDLGKAAIALIGAIVFRSFEGEVTHFLLDDPRIATKATGWESDGSDVMQQTLIELVEMLGSGQLKVADCVLDHLDGVNKTEAIRVKVSC